MEKKLTIAIFCASRAGDRPEYTEAAKALALGLHSMNARLVYGGATVGLMGILADTLLEAGGEVIGVIPQHLADKEIEHKGLTQLHIVNSLHERKALMADLADAFVLLPGGLGSLDEFFEGFTWGSLGLHHKPCALLNSCGYYDLLLQFLEHAMASQFISPKVYQQLIVDESPMVLLKKIESLQPVQSRSPFMGISS